MTDTPFQVPREAASVILARPRMGGHELEFFLLRRHRKASFMATAFVFPGGAADPGESDPRVTAARELFEEAGVLLSDVPVEPAALADWRARLHEGARLDELLGQVRIAVDELHYFAHWITPSIEKKRFSARFFVARLPAGQTPSFDNRETVDEVWVTASEALERAGELRLPPPQVRTFSELRVAAEAGWEALVAESARRAAHAFPIMPRMCPTPNHGGGGFALLLPWDPHYESAGTGDQHPMPADNPFGTGPSRFILEDGTWKNVDAPGSTRQG
jgi:8-oxo-dGTP pyrophosphatase MutT (NUDIX family)